MLQSDELELQDRHGSRSLIQIVRDETVPAIGMFSAKPYLLVAILGTVGFFLVLYGTSLFGPGLYPDSASYISAAKNLVAGKGLALFDGDPYVQWPPAFPALLAVLSYMGFDPVSSSRYLNAGAFAGIVVVSGLWALRYTRSTLLALCSTLVALFALPLFVVSISCLTEPLFILLVILFLFFFPTFVQDGRSKHLYLLSLILMLAVLTRYAGITLAVSAMILPLLRTKQAWRQKVYQLVLLEGAAIIPLLLWFARGRYVEGSMVGARGASPTTLIQNLQRMALVQYHWLIPPGLFSSPVVPNILFLLLVTSAVGGVFFLMKRGNRSNLTAANSLLVFLLIYGVFMLLSAATVALDPIDDRLLSPMYIPLFLLFIYLISSLSSGGNKRSARLCNLVIFAAGLLWLASYPVPKVATLLGQTVKDGAGGYNQGIWRNSQTLDFLQKSDMNHIYSNAPAAIYLLADKAAHSTPRRYLYNSPSSKTTDLEEFAKVLRQGDEVQIVWFNFLRKDFLSSPEEIFSLLGVSANQRYLFSDGVIYTMSVRK